MDVVSFFLGYNLGMLRVLCYAVHHHCSFLEYLALFFLVQFSP